MEITDDELRGAAKIAQEAYQKAQKEIPLYEGRRFYLGVERSTLCWGDSMVFDTFLRVVLAGKPYLNDRQETALLNSMAKAMTDAGIECEMEWM